jgi:hypothetical protein
MRVTRIHPMFAKYVAMSSGVVVTKFHSERGQGILRRY